MHKRSPQGDVSPQATKILSKLLAQTLAHCPDDDILKLVELPEKGRTDLSDALLLLTAMDGALAAKES